LLVNVRCIVRRCLGLPGRRRREPGYLEAQRGQVEVQPRRSKNTSVVYEATGDSIKVTVDGVGAMANRRTMMDRQIRRQRLPLTGDPTADTRSYKKIAARTLELTNKMGGKVVASGKIIISAMASPAPSPSAAPTPVGKNNQHRGLRQTIIRCEHTSMGRLFRGPFFGAKPALTSFFRGHISCYARPALGPASG